MVAATEHDGVATSVKTNALASVSSLKTPEKAPTDREGVALVEETRTELVKLAPGPSDPEPKQRMNGTCASGPRNVESKHCCSPRELEKLESVT
jgi:hypothetical protein